MENFNTSMKHPILNNIWKFISYLFVLVITAYFYFLLTIKFTDFSNTIVLIETIVSFFLIGILNLGLWNYILYNKSKDTSFYWLVLKQLSASVIYSIAWIFISWIILIFIVPNQNDYFTLLQTTFEIKLFFGIMIYFLLVFFYRLIISNKKNKENIQQSKELETLLQQEELNSLKAQINPHFLFNSLNSISSLVYENADDAHEAIVKLSEYFRYTLTLSKNQFTKVKDEIDNIKRYFEIEKIRFPDKLNINYNIEENCLNLLIPVLILQPIAENAVKHGVYLNANKAFINISVKNEEQFYSVVIKNNFDSTTLNKLGTSTGLENIKKRLSVIYKRNDLLMINKTENTFEVKINIPKKAL